MSKKPSMHYYRDAELKKFKMLFTPDTTVSEPSTAMFDEKQRIGGNASYHDDGLNHHTPPNYTTIPQQDEAISIFEAEPFLDQQNSITIAFHPPLSRVGLHKHNFFEIIYIHSGSCTQWIENKKIHLKKGDICILNTQAVHSLLSSSADDIIVNIIMRESMFHEYFMKLIPKNDIISEFFIDSLYKYKDKSQYLTFEFSQNDAIANLIETMVVENSSKKLGYSHAISCYIGVLFCEILRAHRENLDEINYEKLNNTNISDILSYLESNFATATLKSTSEHFFFHPNYLSSLIKKATNKNFSDILRDVKLKQACYFLSTTDISINNVAIETGYANTSFFYRIFKQKFNTTPYEYRKNHQSEKNPKNV